MQNAAVMDNEISGQEQKNDIVAALKRDVRAKKEDIKKQAAAEEAKQILSSVTSQPSATALKWAWGLLIPSFGLSLIWINIHCFFYVVMRDERIVCKLGDEWKVPGAASLNKYGSLANTIEPMAVAFLDFVFFISGVTMVTLIVIMADFYTNPLSYLRVIFEAVYNYFFPTK